VPFAFAVWIRISRKSYATRFAVLQVMTVALYFCHFYATEDRPPAWPVVAASFDCLIHLRSPGDDAQPPPSDGLTKLDEMIWWTLYGIRRE
jgi:hypothetical protein